MPQIKLNDTPFYYEIYGKGEPLLLISGLGSDSSSWSLVAKDLSLFFQVIVFDNRGSGRSGVVSGECNAAAMAQDAIKLLDFLKIENAHILGHSLGGYIAQELAIDYPGRVNKLVLVSTAPVSSSRNNALFENMYNQLKREGCSAAWVKEWVIWLFSPRVAGNTPFIEQFIRKVLDCPYAQKADGFKMQVEAIASFDARDKISSIKAKTLILEGESDILITPQEVEILAQNIPGSALRLLAGVGHCIHIENPGLFVKTVSEFLGFPQ